MSDTTVIPAAAEKPTKLSLLDRITIQGIIALTICFSVVALTVLCFYGSPPKDGPALGIIAGTIQSLTTLLALIVKHFYDTLNPDNTPKN